MACYSLWDHKELDMTEWLNNIFKGKDPLCQGVIFNPMFTALPSKAIKTLKKSQSTSLDENWGTHTHTHTNTLTLKYYSAMWGNEEMKSYHSQQLE